MRLSYFFTFGLVFVLLTACNAALPPQNNPNTLSLTLEIAQREVISFEELQAQIHLSNQSDSKVLVHRRLFYLPFPTSPAWAEMMVLISDSSGNLVSNEYYKPNYDFPSEKTLGVLKPGEEIKENLYLESNGFWDSLFKTGEEFTIVVIYQNDLDITKTFVGGEVPAWVGTIRSNEETFVILP